jgi:hypothetical protein
MRKLLIGVALIATIVISVAGVARAEGAGHDPKIRSVTGPRHVQVGQTFTQDIKAVFRTGTDYAVVWNNFQEIPGLALLAVHCNGILPDNPSPDGSSCEYDSVTAALGQPTHTVVTLQVTSGAPSHVAVPICTATFVADAPRFCRTVHLKIAR